MVLLLDLVLAAGLCLEHDVRFLLSPPFRFCFGFGGAAFRTRFSAREAEGNRLCLAFYPRFWCRLAVFCTLELDFCIRRVRFACNILLLEEGVVLLLYQIRSVEAVELYPFSGLLDAE
jgi:hypothetical protein